jgi:glycosyltransferase involved in cell wall biosynthesis
VNAGQVTGLAEAVELTVVIPAYNEAQRLGPSLDQAVRYLVDRGTRHEILVVDDGSADATSDVAAGRTGVRVLRLPHNQGKGAAVRAGLLASRGERVLVSDADFSTPIGELARLEAGLAEADVVIGSRALRDSVIREHQPIYREFMGKTFNLLIRALGVRGLRDTQCGFKLLRGEAARRLAAALTIDGFAYDVELLWLAHRQGYRIAEMGVQWSNSPDSRVAPLRSSLEMVRDVIRIRFRHRRWQ